MRDLDKVIGSIVEKRSSRLIVEHGSDGYSPRGKHPLFDSHDRFTAVPDIVDDQHAAAVQQGISRKLEKGRLLGATRYTALELYSRDEDITEAQMIGQQGSRHEAAAGYRQQHIVVAATLIGKPGHHRLNLVPGQVLLIDIGHRPSPTSVRAG